MVTLVIEKDPADERATLLAFVEAQRGALRRSVLGLTEEQAARKPSASELSPAGLLKHVVEVEEEWVRRAKGLPEHHRKPETWADSFRLSDSESLADVLARWDEVAEETARFIHSLPSLTETFPLPDAPWFPPGSSVSMRWLLLHLVEEFARHAGHADVIRESLDGRKALELVAEAREG
ncbi:DinB family protein [Streptomyces sp. NPDC001407]|uniref:DinB family protein n=1 Tax=unclassified Streptomyces TaxID=2593676 RepID=UPI0033EE13F3